MWMFWISATLQALLSAVAFGEEYPATTTDFKQAQVYCGGELPSGNPPDAQGVVTYYRCWCKKFSVFFAFGDVEQGCAKGRVRSKPRRYQAEEPTPRMVSKNQVPPVTSVPISEAPPIRTELPLLTVRPTAVASTSQSRVPKTSSQKNKPPAPRPKARVALPLSNSEKDLVALLAARLEVGVGTPSADQSVGIDLILDTSKSMQGLPAEVAYAVRLLLVRVATHVFTGKISARIFRGPHLWPNEGDEYVNVLHQVTRSLNQPRLNEKRIVLLLGDGMSSHHRIHSPGYRDPDTQVSQGRVWRDLNLKDRYPGERAKKLADSSRASPDDVIRWQTLQLNLGMQEMESALLEVSRSSDAFFYVRNIPPNRIPEVSWTQYSKELFREIPYSGLMYDVVSVLMNKSASLRTKIKRVDWDPPHDFRSPAEIAEDLLRQALDGKSR